MLNAGFRLLDVDDAVQGCRIAVSLLYPTQGPERMMPFGPFQLPLAMSAPVEGEALQLVVISHGSGGTPFTHRDLARHLARSGFVVALVQHPGNHRGDDSLAGKVSNLQNRPRHLRLVMDAVFGDAELGRHLAPGVAIVIGHSMGGYTALAIAGGNPRSFPGETSDGTTGPVEVEHDGRVKAIVLLAPATVWFLEPGELSDVKVPILMRTGEKDFLLAPIHTQIVEQGIRDPKQLDHRVVPNAGHFAFLSAYPAAMKTPAIPPSQDPEGFNREAYLPVMFEEIVAFARAVGT